MEQVVANLNLYVDKIYEYAPTMSLEFLTLCVTSTNTIKNDISTPSSMVIDAIKMISEIGNAYISLSRTNDSDNLSNYDMKCMLDSLKKYFELKIKDIYL